MTLENRFWEKLEVGGPDECWEWQGCLTGAGYGQIRDGGKALYAHRISWELSNGKIPDGLCVCHKCDNPKCCNPGHLFLGTTKDNTRDMLRKGRGSPPPLHIGEGNPNHKLTKKDVEEIREKRSLGITTYALGKEYGVTAANISQVAKNHTWKEVPYDMPTSDPTAVS
jgi:hypothetical protein